MLSHNLNETMKLCNLIHNSMINFPCLAPFGLVSNVFKLSVNFLNGGVLWVSVQIAEKLAKSFKFEYTKLGRFGPSIELYHSSI